MNCLKETIKLAGPTNFDIRGLGTKRISILLEAGVIREPLDILNVKESDLLEHVRMGEANSEIVAKSIVLAKDLSIYNFITMLGVRSLARSKVRMVMGPHPTLDDFIENSDEKPDFYFEEASAKLYHRLRSDETKELYAKLKEYGVRVYNPAFREAPKMTIVRDQSLSKEMEFALLRLEKRNSIILKCNYHQTQGDKVVLLCSDQSESLLRQAKWYDAQRVPLDNFDQWYKENFS